MSLTPHHDIRYDMPLMAFLAVIATGWISCLPRGPRVAALALLAVGVVANTLGLDFGVGREVKLALVRSPPNTQQLPDQVIVYTTTGFLVSAPSRDGDVPGLLEALHRDGVRTVTWAIAQSEAPDFSYEGLLPLAQIAGLAPVVTQSPELSGDASVATLEHKSAGVGDPPSCARLSDGTGVWVVRFDAAAHKLAFYCPTRRPRFYDPGGAG